VYFALVLQCTLYSKEVFAEFQFFIMS